MNFLKIISYLLGILFVSVASVSYYFVNQGTISINTYTLLVTISIALAIFFFQFGKSMKIESTINDLSKLPHLEKMVEEAKTVEEKIRVLETEKENLFEYIETESRRIFLLKQVEDLDKQLADSYESVAPTLKEIDIIEKELKQINNTYSSSVSLKEFEKIRERIKAKRKGELFLKIGKEEYKIKEEYLLLFPRFFREFITGYVMILNNLFDKKEKRRKIKENEK
jgi:flagellar biosynthesis chaperone FliJ